MPTGASRARRWRSSPSPIRRCAPSSTACCFCGRTSLRATTPIARCSGVSRCSARPASSSSTLRDARCRACASSATSRRSASCARLPPLAIDHAVIAVRDLAAAAADFAALGFTLTPLGRHSIGSRNHCVMLGSTYIELLEPAGAHPWLAYYREFVARGEGLAALALATNDADASFRDLVAQ